MQVSSLMLIDLSSDLLCSAQPRVPALTAAKNDPLTVNDTSEHVRFLDSSPGGRGIGTLGLLSGRGLRIMNSAAGTPGRLSMQST